MTTTSSNRAAGGPAADRGRRIIPPPSGRQGGTTTAATAPSQSQSTTTTTQGDDEIGGGGGSRAVLVSAQQADDRAQALERQLAVLESSTLASVGAAAVVASSSTKPSASTTTKDQANNLRVQICELLADVLLTDACHAVTCHAIERMWRKCFYVRISHLRSKIAKKKNRSPPQPQRGVTTSAAVDPSLTALEQHLVLFLGEAITLYEYLVDKLQEKLVSAIGSNHGEDDDSGDDGTYRQGSSTAAVATVECLHRLYICLGDLHRYTATATAATNGAPTSTTTTSPNKAAEASYLRAAVLGPGMGHPANQLGVLCGLQILSSNAKSTSQPVQNNNRSALGLYWYARSLLASKDPFETTFVNLQRLFHANHVWLERNASTAAAAATSSTATNKSLQASLFLARFVQFHGRLFTDEAFLDVAAAPEGATAGATVVTVMDEVLQGFNNLLRQSAISDSLLVKLVTIQAFTESYKPVRDAVPRTVEVVHTDAGASKSGENLHWTRRRLWARLSTLRMGTGMADRIVATLQQRLQSQSQSRHQQTTASVPAVRLLLPLLLLTEYVYNTAADLELTVRQERAVSPDVAELYRSSSNDFWQTLAQILNWIGTALPADVAAAAEAATAAAAVSGTQDAVSGSTMPADYMSLQGFTPFASFIPQGKDSGFLSPRRAVHVLQEERASSSTTTASTAVGSAPPTQQDGSGSSAKSSQESNRVKLVARFWTVGHQLAREDSSPSLRGFRRIAGGRFLYEAPAFDEPQTTDKSVECYGNNNDKTMDYDEGDDDGGDTLNVFQEDDPVRSDEHLNDLSGGVLVYKSGGAGGPALLMPGALLAKPAVDAVPSPEIPTPAAAAVAPPEPHGLIGVDLGWLNGPKPQPRDEMADRTNDPMEIDKSFVADVARTDEPQVPDFLEELNPGMFANSTAPGLSATDSALPATVLPPPGFGSLTGPSVLASTQFLFSGAALPPVPPVTELTLLEASGQLFGPPPPTANPFATMHGASYSFPPRSMHDGLVAQQPPGLFPQGNNDPLWMIQDVLGRDEGFEEASLLDSGLLNSLLNDDTSTSTKNPFAT